MRLVETCSCGASIAVSDEMSYSAVTKMVSDWRDNHRCDPGKDWDDNPPIETESIWKLHTH